MLKEFIYAQSQLQHLGCCNLLEKLALIFVNSFHPKHILLKIIIKKVIPNIKVKNIKTSLVGLTLPSVRLFFTGYLIYNFRL